jgi:CheY-like chemotaxis protein
VVESCLYPKDALEKCRRWPAKYGLVFMDILFPEGPVGYSVSRQISDINGPGFPIIIGMTGLKPFYDYLGRSKYGMTDVLLKPVNKNLMVSLATAYVTA